MVVGHRAKVGKTSAERRKRPDSERPEFAFGLSIAELFLPLKRRSHRMVLRPHIVSLFCSVLVCQSVFAAGATDGKLSGLVTNSPFGTGRSPGAATGVHSGEPFEFRAVVAEGDNKFFSIYDTATKRSNWVEVNDPVNGFSVKGYDAGKETITVDYQGKTMTLAIKRAPAVAQAMQQPMPVSNGMPQPGVNPSAQPMPGPSAVDQQRIQQIQEEIRRRRALRNQSVLPGHGPQPQVQPGSFGPVPQPVPGSGPVPQPAPRSGP